MQFFMPSKRRSESTPQASGAGTPPSSGSSENGAADADPRTISAARRPSLTNPWDGIDADDVVKQKYPKFAAALDKLYPGALQHEEAAVASKHVLRQHGFTAHNSIALVAQCRDEIAKPFNTAIDHNWLGSFNISSLAGTVFCGKTGFNAALHHAPQDDEGKERYVVFVGPHIAIDENGNVGNVMRRGRKGMSSACGALIAFQSELKSGKVDLEDKPLDVEYCHLKRHLIRRVEFGKEAPSLAQVTQFAHDATVDDVREIFKGLGKQNSIHAIVSGILIHGPDFTHYFWPGVMDVTEDGHEASIDVRSELMSATRADYLAEMLRYQASRAEAACVDCSDPQSLRIEAENISALSKVHNLSQHGPSAMLASMNMNADKLKA